MASSSAPSSHPFTCNTCQVAFKSSDMQRTHMQSDWHRYNLKRRVASLPPLSSEIFVEKVLASKADAAATAARAQYEKLCQPCNKNYYSENAFNNHLASQKHKTNVVRLTRAGAKIKDETASVMSSTFSLGATSVQTAENDSEAEDEFSKVVDGLKDANLDDSDDTDPVSRRPTRPHHSAAGEGIPEHPLSPTVTNTTASKDGSTPTGELPRDRALRSCLFCKVVSQNLPSNVKHMTKIHGLFIPEQQYLVDLDGLILHLARKVYDDYQCLYCGRLKWSEDGIKTHMRDTSHCKIAYDTEEQQLDIGEFYDFRSTYSDEETDEDEEMLDEDAAPGGGVKLGAARAVKTEIHADHEILPDADEGDAGWETSSEVSSVPTSELGALYADDDDAHRAARISRLRQHRHHTHSDYRKHRHADGFHSHAHNPPRAVYYDEFELHLPSGRIAGHRSLNRYYRQNLHSYPTAEERVQRLLTAGSSEDEELVERGRDRNRQLISRADGGLGMITVSEAKKKQVKAMEKRERQKEARALARSQWRTNLKGNSQKHFRDPLLQ
jgi:pre-60S factor REI1